MDGELGTETQASNADGKNQGSGSAVSTVDWKEMNMCKRHPCFERPWAKMFKTRRQWSVHPEDKHIQNKKGAVSERNMKKMIFHGPSVPQGPS